jgi:hypothetical protein
MSDQSIGKLCDGADTSSNMHTINTDSTIFITQKRSKYKHIAERHNVMLENDVSKISDILGIMMIYPTKQKYDSQTGQRKYAIQDLRYDIKRGYIAITKPLERVDQRPPRILLDTSVDVFVDALDNETDYDGMVYFIQEENNNQFKIGFTTKNWKNRLSNINVGNWRTLYMRRFVVCNAPKLYEDYMHECFETSHIKGEWFNLTIDEVDGLVDHINGLTSNTT